MGERREKPAVGTRVWWVSVHDGHPEVVEGEVRQHYAQGFRARSFDRKVSTTLYTFGRWDWWLEPGPAYAEALRSPSCRAPGAPDIRRADEMRAAARARHAALVAEADAVLARGLKDADALQRAIESTHARRLAARERLVDGARRLGIADAKAEALAAALTAEEAGR